MMSQYEDIKEFIYEWNTNYPVDRWWRKKYNIAFNSPAHRVSNFIDQLIDYYEDNIFTGLLKKEKEEEDNIFYKSDKYIPGSGNWLRSQEISDEAFKNIDLFQFDDK
jgi:hypothetical protein